jgi:hypothetical protein
VRVDAYTATVRAGGDEALAWCLEAFPDAQGLQIGQDGAINRWKYEHGVGLFQGRSAVGAVRWGGNGGGTSIELKGSIAHETFGLLRARWSPHSCSRMDVAVDLAAPGLFDLALDRLRGIARGSNPKIAMEPRGDWEYGEKGRTMYFGSRDSDAQVVLYEKGLEQFARGEPLWDPSHVRLELRLHPQKSGTKYTLAELVPSDAWGWTGWTTAALEAFTGLNASRVELPPRLHDDERAYRAMVKQYGGLLDRLADGHWHNLTARLRDDCEGRNARRKRAA